MRVKQTARKSTGAPSQSQSISVVSSRGARANARQSMPASSSSSSIASSSETDRSRFSDPVNSRMRNLLETKRQRGLKTRGGKESGKGARPSGKYIEDVKKKPKSRRVNLALSEIKKLQNSTNLLIPRMPFHRLIREITQNLTSHLKLPHPYLYQSAALSALQDAAESYLTSLFEDSYLCTIHAKRVTLFTSDMLLCKRLRERVGAV